MSALEIRAALRRGDFRLDLDLALGTGVTGVTGPSGSGKSTLLHALAGLLPAERLRLVLGGEVVVDTEAGVSPPAHRRAVGLVFQDHRLFPHLSVDRNLGFGEAAGVAVDRDEVVELLELGGLLDRLPRDCSGGQRQRVAIGRALLAGPRLLLLDEPLSSLDRTLKRQVLPFLRRVHQRFGLPTLMVSHDVSDLLALSDELLLIEGGSAAAQGDLATLAADAAAVELLSETGLAFSLPGRLARRDGSGLAWIGLEARGGGHGVEVACGLASGDPGDDVEVVLEPADVVLGLPPLDARLSLTNHLRGTVAEITRTSARCIVRVDCGLAAPVLAEVTEGAVARLGLAAGSEVVALFKAQASRARGLGRR